MHYATLMIVSVVGVMGATTIEDAVRHEFDAWSKVHVRAYASEEEAVRRFDIFKANRAFVMSHNERARQGRISFTTALNQFADLTNDEYRQQMLGLGMRGKHSPGRDAVSTFRGGVTTAPESFDWRPSGIVTPVKDQAQCGSCWAFSAVAAIEGAFNKKNNGSMPSGCSSSCNGNACCSFSEQELVDCTNSGEDTCKIGGEMHDGVMEIVKHHSSNMDTEAVYPYTSGGGKSSGVCRAKAKGAVPTGITGYANVTAGDEDALKAAVFEHATISIGIDASQMSFQFYSSGVYDEPRCHNKVEQLDHGVSIVGYGVQSGPSPSPPGPGPGPGPGPSDCPNNPKQKGCEAEDGCHWCPDPLFPSEGFCFSFACPSQAKPYANATAPLVEARESRKEAAKTPYWIVRNSWGEGWGMSGYILMSRNKGNQCGVACDAIYVLI